MRLTAMNNGNERGVERPNSAGPWLWRDKTMSPSRLSRFGMTCSIDIFIGQCKMDSWTKNTDTAKNATALSAARHSSPETEEVSSNAVQTHVAELFRPRRRHALAQSAESNSSPPGLDTKRVPANAGRLCAFRAGRLTRWSKSENALRFSVVRSLLDAYGTRLTELPRFLAIQSKNCVRTLSAILNLGCRGVTMEMVATNGA